MKRKHNDDDDDDVNEKKNDNDDVDCILSLNVGGKEVDTLKSTLTIYSTSMLAIMFRDDNIKTLRTDKNGRIFIDANPKIFLLILHYLRRGISFNIIPENFDENQWNKELDYWGLLPSNITLDKDGFDINTKEKEESFSSLIEKSVDESKERIDEALRVILTLSNGKENFKNGHMEVDVYIPIKEESYLLSWGIDIGKYLSDSRIQSRIKSIYSRYKQNQSYFITIENHSSANKFQKNYSFNGKRYNTVENPSITVHIELANVERMLCVTSK